MAGLWKNLWSIFTKCIKIFVTIVPVYLLWARRLEKSTLLMYIYYLISLFIKSLKFTSWSTSRICIGLNYFAFIKKIFVLNSDIGPLEYSIYTSQILLCQHIQKIRVVIIPLEHFIRNLPHHQILYRELSVNLKLWNIISNKNSHYYINNLFLKKKTTVNLILTFNL